MKWICDKIAKIYSVNSCYFCHITFLDLKQDPLQKTCAVFQQKIFLLNATNKHFEYLFTLNCHFNS